MSILELLRNRPSHCTPLSSRRRAIRALAAGMLAPIALLATAAPGAAQPQPVAVPGPDLDAARLLIDLANGERAGTGAPTLTSRSDVTAIALGHSTTMAVTGNLHHNDAYFGESTRVLLASKARAENVAQNMSVEDAHRRLMASPGHRANLLDPRFTVVGFAVVRSVSGQYWVTQNFLQPASAAAPAAAAPTPPPAPVPPRAAPAPAPARVGVAPKPTAAPKRAAPQPEVRVVTASVKAPEVPQPTPPTAVTLELPMVETDPGGTTAQARSTNLPWLGTVLAAVALLFVSGVLVARHRAGA